MIRRSRNSGIDDFFHLSRLRLLQFGGRSTLRFDGNTFRERVALYFWCWIGCPSDAGIIVSFAGAGLMKLKAASQNQEASNRHFRLLASHSL
jgi:hypothetical protein